MKRRRVAVVRLDGSWGSVGDSRAGGLHWDPGVPVAPSGKGGCHPRCGWVFFSFFFLKKSWLPQTK